MAPRKSTGSNMADANGDVSMVSNATAASTTSHAHPKPARQSGGGAKQDADGVGIDVRYSSQCLMIGIRYAHATNAI